MRSKWHWLFFFQIVALGSLSVLIISAINPTLARNQLLFWAAGLFVLFWVSRLDYTRWANYSAILYALCLVILVLLLLFGEPFRGSVRWVDLGFFRFQPSEITKAAIILFLASFYSRSSAGKLTNLSLGFIFTLPAIVLVFFQPDIGNTFAFFAIWAGIAFASGLRVKHALILFTTSAIVLFLLFQVLAPYQKERLISFANPVSDPLGTGYNIIQSKIAIGSGLIFGKGYGHGSQSQLQFLPEAESDFIFAAIAEQLGLVGAGLILILFTWLIFRAVNICKNADRFAQLIIVGAISYLSIQFLVNVGMNMGLLPVTGITLPLISYGGSSLITNLFILGIVFSIARKSY